MKKTYISPLTEICDVMVENLLQVGSTKGTSVFNDDANPNYDVLSRRSHSLWDDDEEEDY